METTNETSQSPYKFERGYPAAGTAERVHDASDMRRAIEVGRESARTEPLLDDDDVFAMARGPSRRP